MKKNFKLLFAFAICCLVLFSATGFVPKTMASAATPVTISFNANGGIVDTQSSLTDEDGKLSSLPTPTYAGYVFMGWYKSLSSTEEPAVTLDTVFSENTVLYAKWIDKTYSYVISKTESGTAKIVGSSKSESLTYVLAEGLTENSQVMSAIQNDITEKTEQVVLKFDNFSSLDNSPFEIDFKNVLVTGKITSTFSSPILKLNAPQNNTTILIQNLELNGDSTLVSFVSSTNSADVTFDTVNLVSATTSTYGFDLASTNYSLTFKNHFTHTQKKLLHFIDGLNVNLYGDYNGTEHLSDTSKIVMSVDYNSNGKLLMNKFYSVYNNDVLELVPTDNFYLVEKDLNIPNLYVKTYIRINYNLNGGAFASGSSVSYKFAFTPNTPDERIYNFPDSESVVFAHNTFLGWFGKLNISDEEKALYNLDSNIYYFDKDMLQSLLDAGADLSKVNEYFKLDLSELDSTKSFSTYSYDNTETSINYLTMKFFISLKKTPTFIAKYEQIDYSISFESNGGSPVDTITGKYGDVVLEPTAPTKTGYTFVGWFEDEDLRYEYSFSSMPDTNPTLYAKWQINSYTISFVTNCDSTLSPLTAQYGSEISDPNNITLEGYMFDGWYLDSGLTNKFTFSTMPAENLTLYAKWSILKYKIYLYRGVDLQLEYIEAEYNSKVNEPAAPTRTGYDFFGWYTDQTYKTKYVFDKMPAKNIIIYAQWLIKEYSITFVTNCPYPISPIKQDYDTKVYAPATPDYSGYKFGGWFEDEALTTRYTFSTMPAQNITLYAKWTAKHVISLELGAKTAQLKNASGYTLDSSMNGLIIEYLIDGEWTTKLPEKIGKYDVRISREEDEDYQAYSKVIENGYIITANEIDIAWLIVLFFVLTIIEIIAIFIIRRLRKEKLKNGVLYSVALSFGTIKTSQFVLAIVSGVLMIFGFVVLIYELVKLHKTNPEIDIKPSKFDNQATIARMHDISEDSKINSKVDDLLNKEFNVDQMKKEIDEKNRENEELIKKTEKDPYGLSSPEKHEEINENDDYNNKKE